MPTPIANPSIEPPRRAFQLCALAVAVSVFPLIWMGGLVTSKGAGLSVPDWPNTYGYNMFLFPPSQWIGGIFYEHTHRLLGTVSGFLSIILVLLAWAPARTPALRYRLGVFTVAMGMIVAALLVIRWPLSEAGQMAGGFARAFSHLLVLFGSCGAIAAIAWCCRHREPRRWLRWLTIVQLLAIIVQGTLGGLRVTEVNLDLAIIHACFAQCFFCLAAFTALAASRWWWTSPDLSTEHDAATGRRTLAAAVAAMVLIAAQLVAGAMMRHNRAGLAIPDLPLAFGQLIPPTDADGLHRANEIRRWDYELPEEMSLTQVWLHFSHRVGAIAVTAAILLIAWMVFRKLRDRRAVTTASAILLGLVVVQFTLGVLTVWLRKPADIASLHVAVGALTFMAASQAVAVLARQYFRRTRPVADTAAQASQFAVA